MLNTKSGKPLAMIVGGDNDGKIICVDENYSDGYDIIDLFQDSSLKPLMNYYDYRGVYYIAGPSGSGKSTYAINLIKDFLKIFPKSDFFLFSRTDYKIDPIFKGMKISQIKLDDNLLNNPIDIEKELNDHSILFFDDCNTIQNHKLKIYVEHLMNDVMEIGRKLKINIIITNHLVIPNEKKFARTILNEVQYLTVFPKSGSSQQILYALKTYFGFNKKQADHVLNLPSRWVTIIKMYPLIVMFDKGIYIL